MMVEAIGTIAIVASLTIPANWFVRLLLERVKAVPGTEARAAGSASWSGW